MVPATNLAQMKYAKRSWALLEEFLNIVLFAWGKVGDSSRHRHLPRHTVLPKGPKFAARDCVGKNVCLSSLPFELLQMGSMLIHSLYNTSFILKLSGLEF